MYDSRKVSSYIYVLQDYKASYQGFRRIKRWLIHCRWDKVTYRFIATFIVSGMSRHKGETPAYPNGLAEFIASICWNIFRYLFFGFDMGLIFEYITRSDVMFNKDEIVLFFNTKKNYDSIFYSTYLLIRGYL